MKSFHLYRCPNVAPTRFGGDYSIEQRAKLVGLSAPLPRSTDVIRESFCGGYSVLPALLSHAAFCTVPRVWFRESPAGLSVLARWSRLQPLLCPGCGNEMEHPLGGYCPECGGGPLRPAGPFGATACLTCGRALRYRKGRKFKVRACTDCGLVLDEKGL